MTDRIGIGVIGANSRRGWASRSHLPALIASPEFELIGVCTTRMESAKEAAKKFGARLAFDNYQQMLANPDISAVAVVIRVPSHYEPTMAALDAGKHVYTEWPLGQTTAQAREMAEVARSKGVVHMVGLQARANPAIIHLKSLIGCGYVGEVLSCRVSMIRGGVLQRDSGRVWQRDAELGANTLTVAFGHTVDALRFVVDEFRDVSSVISTQVKQWKTSDTGALLNVTSPDNVMIAGNLVNGAVASVHVATIPYAGSGLRFEIYGRDGTLIAVSDGSPQLREVRLQGTQGDRRPAKIEVPSNSNELEEMPNGEAFNVRRMYLRFGEAIRSGALCEPNFVTAAELHSFIDKVRKSSKDGRRTAVRTG